LPARGASSNPGFRRHASLRNISRMSPIERTPGEGAVRAAALERQIDPLLPGCRIRRHAAASRLLL